MTLDDFLLEAEDKMSKTEQVVVNEFAGVRTGKASPALVENIMVEVYGSQMRIRELAGITTPEPRTLTIQPWDVNSLHPIEKAIQKSNLGLTPVHSRQGHSPVLPRTQRGAAPGIREDHPQDGRRWPRGDPPRPARRHGATEEARPRQRRHRRRRQARREGTAEANGRVHRARSTPTWPTRKKRS